MQFIKNFYYKRQTNLIKDKFDNNLFIVDNEYENIEKIFKNFNVIQLRKYRNEKNLIIGCGNLSDNLKKELSNSEYIKLHKHENYYTIDPNIKLNPSIVGDFGIDDFSFLPCSFENIIFEGFMLNCFKYKDEKVDEEKIKKKEIFYHPDFLKKYRKYKNSEKIETRNYRTIRDLLLILKENGIIFFGDRPKFKKIKNKLISIDEPSLIISNDSPENFYIFSKLYR